MNAIGGYFELECGSGRELHPEAIRLNSGRNCLRYLVRAHRIRRMLVPGYICPVVWDALRAEGCEVVLYNLREDFMPDLPGGDTAWLLYNNYFGICAEQLRRVRSLFPNCVADHSQALFCREGVGENAFYSPRKFAGV